MRSRCVAVGPLLAPRRRERRRQDALAPQLAQDLHQQPRPLLPVAAADQHVVVAAKPLIVRSGFSQETEKIGTLNQRLVVTVLDTRYLEDGTQRSMVSSVAG